MAKNGTYYLGRIIKTGALETKHIMAALRSPEAFTSYGSAWTFLDINEFSDGRTSYFFGRLVKYDPEGEVTIVDPKARREVIQREPNMTIASSPFVYIPDHSGLAFLHVSGQIDYEIFMSRWSSVVNVSHHEILSECIVEPIADLSSFSKKLNSLDSIYFLSASVSPPNPMFGPLWENLKNYLIQRKTERMKIEEDGEFAKPLQTDLPMHVQAVLEQTEEMPYLPEPLPIGDAAILMAADGYGKGTVRGKKDGIVIMIKTSETAMNFSFSRDPEPQELYEKAVEIFEYVRLERHMRH